MSPRGVASVAVLILAMTLPGAVPAMAATPGGPCPDGITCDSGDRPRLLHRTPPASGGGETSGSDGTTLPDRRSAAARFGWGDPDTARGDDFDGAEGIEGWNLYDSPGHAGNGIRSPEAITVEDGVLTIEGTADGTSGGMMGRAVQPRFGRWEVRMRVDKRGGGGAYHPVVALIPYGRPYDRGSGDLDFAEADAGSGEVYCFIHYDGRQDYLSVPVDLEDWHTYAVEVAPTHITWFVDGRPAMTDTDEDAITGTPWTLNLQLDAYQPSGQAPSTMEIDYFRFHPLPDGDVPIRKAQAPRTGSYGG